MTQLRHLRQLLSITLLYFTTVLYCTLLLYCLPHSMVHLHIESRENLWCGFSVAVDLDLVLSRTYVLLSTRSKSTATLKPHHRFSLDSMCRCSVVRKKIEQ